MISNFTKEAVGWGFGLWLIGYLMGFVFFFFIPIHLIGWVITPIATVVTVWVLLKKIHGSSVGYYFNIGIVWLIIAVICDYVFVVKLLNPEDGYYKLDVYLYYTLTLGLPIMIGMYKLNNEKRNKQGLA